MFLTIAALIGLGLVFVVAVAAMWFGTVHGDLKVEVYSSRTHRLARK